MENLAMGFPAHWEKTWQVVSQWLSLVWAGSGGKRKLPSLGGGGDGKGAWMDVEALAAEPEARRLFTSCPCYQLSSL